MAGSVLGSLFSRSQTTFASDLGVAMWPGIIVKRVTLSPEAEVTENPVQVTVIDSQTAPGQGSTVDRSTIALELGPYKIIAAAKVDVELFCKTIDALTNLIQSFQDNTLLIRMVSKSAVVDNLAMVNMKISNSPRIMNATLVVISFEQAPPKDSRSVATEQGGDAPDLGVGTISLGNTSPTLESISDGLKNGIGSLF